MFERNKSNKNNTKPKTKQKKVTFVNNVNNVNEIDDGGLGGGVNMEKEDESNHLFSQVLAGQVSMQSIVDDWIELYKKDKDTAMIDLIRFIVRCSGCKAASSSLFNKELLRTKEFTQCINELIDSFNDADTDDNNNAAIEQYPLIQTSLQARRFKSNFAEFLQLLVNQCQYSIIYDQYMLDILISFLIGTLFLLFLLFNFKRL